MTSINDSSLLTQHEDFCRYRTLVQSGEFYDFLLAQLGDCMSREDLKRRFLADVIAKRKANRVTGAEYPSKVEDCFRGLFPKVYSIIRQINRDGLEHANLIRMLQREESRLVIETVAADLTAAYPNVFFITLHDAIYTTSEHLPKVERAFLLAFEQMGFAMKLKIEA